MLNFRDWQTIQAMTLSGPSGASSAFQNVPMGERGIGYRGSPDSIFKDATRGLRGAREREVHNTEDGQSWQFDTMYAAPPRRNTWS